MNMGPPIYAGSTASRIAEILVPVEAIGPAMSEQIRADVREIKFVRAADIVGEQSAMTDDLDIWRSAHLLVNRHGD
jgi:hypothetical protein